MEVPCADTSPQASHSHSQQRQSGSIIETHSCVQLQDFYSLLLSLLQRLVQDTAEVDGARRSTTKIINGIWRDIGCLWVALGGCVEKLPVIVTEHMLSTLTCHSSKSLIKLVCPLSAASPIALPIHCLGSGLDLLSTDGGVTSRIAPPRRSISCTSFS